MITQNKSCPTAAGTLYLVGVFFLFSGCSQKTAHYNQWETIFNGQDLTGWQMKFTGEDPGVNYKNTFRVEHGNLIVSYNDYTTFNNKFGYLFYQENLSNYRLRLEYRFVGKQVAGGPEWGYKNSGIKFHSQPPAAIPKDQELLVAIEAQLLGGNGTDERPTGNVCTAGTNIEINGELSSSHCINSSSQTYSDEQWVTIELEVHGNGKVIHRINGKKVLAYEKPQLDETDPFAQQLLREGHSKMLSGGYIALQAESHPVEFRHIQLMRLEE